ncbi:thioredoxin family protein [Erysipelotrichaceae bacterium RD49]|nr:thioredoxin family protein [Erysipelotrichaceae bacterium RD49]
MKQIHTLEEVNQLKNSTKPVVFLWSANWCPDCLYLVPFLDQIEKDNPDFDFYKLDRDELLDEAIDQEILGIPSFTVFKNSKEIGRFVSKLRKTPQEIQEFLNSVKEA